MFSSNRQNLATHDQAARTSSQLTARSILWSPLSKPLFSSKTPSGSKIRKKTLWLKINSKWYSQMKSKDNSGFQLAQRGRKSKRPLLLEALNSAWACYSSMLVAWFSQGNLDFQGIVQANTPYNRNRCSPSSNNSNFSSHLCPLCTATCTPKQKRGSSMFWHRLARTQEKDRAKVFLLLEANKWLGK